MSRAPDIRSSLQSLGKVYRVLQEAASRGEVFLVGGAVRDILMGRSPADFDFAVPGSGITFAQQLARTLRAKCVVLSPPDDQARVCFRGRLVLDFNGFGAQTIDDDLRRRDFTINAIAWSLGRQELVDPYHGQRAIRSRRIVPVSERSFGLDPLRVLRAFRFALELGFSFSRQVMALARDVALDGVAAERIGYELMRILDCDRSGDCLAQLERAGFLHQIFPEATTLFDSRELLTHSLATCRKLDELVHGTSYFSQFEPEFGAYFAGNPRHRALLKLAGLFHDVAKPETEFVNDRDETHFYRHDIIGGRRVETMARQRLRLSRSDVHILRTLVGYHMRLHLLATGPELTERAIRRYFRDLKEQYFGLMLLTYADGFATAGITCHLEEKFARMIELKRRQDSIVKVKRLVTGNDLIALGLVPGPAFKTILAELEELQVEGKIASKEQGLEYVRQAQGQGAGQACEVCG